MVLANYQPCRLAARHVCVLVRLAAILGWIGVLTAGAEEQAVPRITDPVYQFADTVPGAEVKHVFFIANPTQAPLRVTRVRTSCGCTAGQVVPETIPAGGEGRLEVVFKTTGRTGPQRKHIFVSTDSSQAPLLQCSVEGTLLPPAGGPGRATPSLATDPRHEFGTVVSGTQVHHTFTLRNQSGAALAFASLVCSTSRLRAKLAGGQVAAGETIDLDVDLDTTGLAGAQQVSVTVNLQGQPGPALVCELRGIVATPALPTTATAATTPAASTALLVASVDGVDFGEFWADETPVLEVTLTNSSAQALRLCRVTSDSPSLSLVCPTRILAPGGSTVLRVQVQRSADERRLHEDILVETDPTGRPLRLPVLGHARPRLRCEPPTVYLRDSHVGTPVERTVTLTSQDGNPFRVESCRTPVAGLTVSATSADDQNTTWKLKFLFDPQTPSRRLRGYVTVATDRPGLQPRIRVSGDVAAP